MENRDLYTRITISKPSFLFSYEDTIVLLGSCFAENMGKKLEETKFRVDINPFGTLYNPASVAGALNRLLQPEEFTASDLFYREGTYHSFAHHSRFSSTSEKECLDRIHTRLFSSAENLIKANRLIITLGTSFVYKLRDTGEIVSNCHKLPEKMFRRDRLTVEEIVENWVNILQKVWKQNPALQVLFTVSPIRHWKDGAHGNQLSKATLLLAIEALQALYPEQISYFPAYEIMMDELRDYRFYADDMLHPSPLAIDYIWNRFMENSFTTETREILKEWTEIQKAIRHKPFQPESEAYKRFISQTLLKMERINEKFPFFDLTNEIGTIKSKLT